jgi:putative DNA primase/helicase
MYHEKTVVAAKGKWRGILLHLGIPSITLRDKHGPCPMCGGEDRFRFDNKEGRGTFICNQCGAGDGMKLAVDFTGRPFAEVAAQIDGILGNTKPDAPPPPPLAADERRMALRRAWAESRPVQEGDLVDTYLRNRGLGERAYPPALRFAPALRDGEGGIRPAMLALVGVHGERPVSLHRTFLAPDGSGKAEMASPRKMMPGELPDSACVALSEWTGNGVLGIAEGIETAMAASARFDVPCWAAISAPMLAKWTPPEGCEEVVIFADHDPTFAGHAAAYRLAQRIAVKGLPVSVQIPPAMGDDWADVWLRERKPVPLVRYNRRNAA